MKHILTFESFINESTLILDEEESSMSESFRTQSTGVDSLLIAPLGKINTRTGKISGNADNVYTEWKKSTLVEVWEKLVFKGKGYTREPFFIFSFSPKHKTPEKGHFSKFTNAISGRQFLEGKFVESFPLSDLASYEIKTAQAYTYK